MPKNILFTFKKVEKHTILAGQGGQETPLALPCGRSCLMLISSVVVKNILLFGQRYFQSKVIDVVVVDSNEEK